MAQKIQTLFIDDLDGSEAEGTVRFGLDGTEYEIDLNAGHAQALRDAWHAMCKLRGGPGAVRGGQPAADVGHRQPGWTVPRSASGPGHRTSR